MNLKAVTLIITSALALSACNSTPSKYSNTNIVGKRSELEFKVNNSNKLNSNLSNELHFPIEASDRQPIVILLHSCAGISKSRSDYVRWAKLLLENGFAVLTLDHLTPRNVYMNCGKGRKIDRTQLVKDVYAASKYLSTIPSIDPNRIFTLGFSLGAMTGGSVASSKYFKNYGEDSPKIRAVAGLYGGCYGRARWLEPDADIPVLWLVGSKDTESPPHSCDLSVHALESKGLISFYEYPNATHCWDCRSLNGFTKRAGNGRMTTYRYNDTVTKDSEMRVLEFFKSFK